MLQPQGHSIPAEAPQQLHTTWGIRHLAATSPAAVCNMTGLDAGRQGQEAADCVIELQAMRATATGVSQPSKQLGTAISWMVPHSLMQSQAPLTQYAKMLTTQVLTACSQRRELLGAMLDMVSCSTPCHQSGQTTSMLLSTAAGNEQHPEARRCCSACVLCLYEYSFTAKTVPSNLD